MRPWLRYCIVLLVLCVSWLLFTSLRENYGNLERARNNASFASLMSLETQKSHNIDNMETTKTTESNISLEGKRIAIIGAGGYVGSGLLEYLEKSGADVTGFDRAPNIPSLPQIQKMSSSEIPDDVLHSFSVVVYLGGLTGRIASMVAPIVLENENINDPINLARRMMKSQVLIFASTSAIGEGSGTFPIYEDSVIKEDMLDPYTKSMYYREKQMRKLSMESPNSPQLIATRFGTVIGHSMGQRVDMVHMALVKSAHMTGVLNIQHGETSRAILALKDLVRAMATIATSPTKCKQRMEVFHLSSFNTVILSVANEVAMQTGARVNIKSHERESPDFVGFSLLNSKFEETFHFKFNETQYSCVRDLIENVPDSITGKGPHQVPPVPVMDGFGNATHSMRCPVCGGYHLQETLDLKAQPLANDFLGTIQEAEKSERFPLKLVRCRSCNHLFLSNMVDRSSLFSKYLYESGTSRTLSKYFEWLADKIAKLTRPKAEKLGRPYAVLEIACNDGSQLDKFKALGWETYGVDPAANIVPKAVEKGHKVEVGFWGIGKYDHLPPPEHLDVILAQNVFAHVPKPVEFLKACKDVMGDDTNLYIQTSQCQMHQDGQFDTAYHEHISFFTGHSFQRAAELAGLHITNFEITPIHGDSCFVSFKKKGHDAMPTSDGLQRRLDAEVGEGMTTDFFYSKYGERAKFTRDWINKQLVGLQNSGYTLGAYGAAAKGMVLLHFLTNVPSKRWKISFVVDDAPMKQGKYCPGTDIPVLSTKSLGEMANGNSIALVVLAWNFWKEIADNIRREMKGKTKEILILLPFPHARIVRLKIDETENEDVILNIPYYPKSWPQKIGMSTHGRRQALLLSHFYNEHMMLPYWISHHAHMFDKAILVDYASTDNSVDLISQLAPSTWKVVNSTRGYEFDAEYCDIEIMAWENTDPLAWKIALTTTEFLIHSSLRQALHTIEISDKEFKIAMENHGAAYNFPAAWIVGDDSNQLLKFTSLPSQRSVMTNSKPMWGPASRYIHVEGKKSRTEVDHSVVGVSTSTSFAYKPGRHSILTQGVDKKWSSLGKSVAGGFVMKYLWSPWPESMMRKFQIGSKVPERDMKEGKGRHHTQMSSSPFDIRRIGEIRDMDIQSALTDLHIVTMDKEKFFFNMWHEALVPEVPLYELTNKTQ